METVECVWLKSKVKKRPQIACDTPVKDGMIVRTKVKILKKLDEIF